ncbi:MAG: hypothetical protein GF390_00565 [Candidatus Pacebacteria bacterium]|nr:hypothetical protein [Candidatus Paceibacterota bacterium]
MYKMLTGLKTLLSDNLGLSLEEQLERGKRARQAWLKAGLSKDHRLFRALEREEHKIRKKMAKKKPTLEGRSSTKDQVGSVTFDWERD